MNELSVENYMMDPCAASTLPYWKAVSIAVPEGMKVVRDDEFEKGGFEGFADEQYFRLIHDLKGLKKPFKPEGFRLRHAGFEEYAAHIRKCYGGGPSADELAGMLKERCIHRSCGLPWRMIQAGSPRPASLSLTAI